ncbi:MAK10-like protein [Tanacetum coccineum]
MCEYIASHTERIERFKEAMLRQRERLDGRMDEMFELLKNLTSSPMPKKVLVREENRHPVTKNNNAISLCKIEKKKVEEDDKVVDKNAIKHNKCSEKSIDAIEEPIGEERKLVELPEPQPVSYYLNHKINKKLIRGLVGNPRLTDEKLVETDIRLSLASQSHIYPLGIAEGVLVEVTGFVYPVDFVILDIKEDGRRPLILGTPFLTTARAEIIFNKGTISLRSDKSTVHFHKCPEPFCKFEGREENVINTLSVVNERVLEWEERIKFYHEKELEFKAWKNKYSKNNELAPKKENSSGTIENQGGVT